MEQRQLVRTSRIEVRWGDMDALGHVNNTIYFRYMEQARIEWLGAIGYVFDRKDGMPVIVNASCNFLRPLVYPASIEVHMYIGQIGRSSMPTFYELRVMGVDTLVAEGSATIVWTSPETGKSVPLPDLVKKTLGDES